LFRLFAYQIPPALLSNLSRASLWSAQSEDSSKTGIAQTQKCDDDDDPDQSVIVFSAAFPDTAESAVAAAEQYNDQHDKEYTVIVSEAATLIASAKATK